MKYLQLPFLLGYNISYLPKVEFDVEAGATLSYVVDPYNYHPEYYSEPASIRTPKIMIAPTAGATVAYKSKRNHYFISFRHDFDFQKYFERNAGATEYSLQHAGTTYISAGISFLL